MKQFQNTYIFYIMNVLVAICITHHFVETEFILSKEKRERRILENKTKNILGLLTLSHTKQQLNHLCWSHLSGTYMSNPASLACLLEFLQVKEDIISSN